MVVFPESCWSDHAPTRVHIGIKCFPWKQIISLFFYREIHLGTTSQVQGCVRGVLFDTSNRNIYHNRWVKTKVPYYAISLTRNCIVKITSGRSTDATKFHFRFTLSTNILDAKNPMTDFFGVNAKYWTKQLRKKPNEFKNNSLQCEAVSRNSKQEGSLLMRRPYMVWDKPRTFLSPWRQYFKHFKVSIALALRTLAYFQSTRISVSLSISVFFNNKHSF